MAYQPLWTSKRQAILDVAERIKAQHPAAWAEVKVPGQPSRTFISLVVAECQKTISADIGCNLKRGGPDVSLDVLALPNPTGARDASGKFAGLELIDIIAGAEGGPSHPEPSIIWLDQTQKTIDAGVPGGWAQPVGTTQQPVPGSLQPYPDEVEWFGGVYEPAVAACYREAGSVFPDNSAAFRWFSRCGWLIGSGMTKEAAMAKCIKELRAALGL
jgi:hypothetical protein